MSEQPESPKKSETPAPTNLEEEGHTADTDLLKAQKDDAKSVVSGRSTKSPAPSNRSGASAIGKKSQSTPSKGEKSPSKSPAKGHKKQPSGKKSALTTGTEKSQAEIAPDGCVPIFLSVPTQEIFEISQEAATSIEEPYHTFISKDDISNDIHNRAAVSEFKEHLNEITSYEGDTILIKSDPEWKYGANFYMVFNEEMRSELLTTQDENQQEVEPVVLGYVPPAPRDWICYGSDKEIVEGTVQNARPTFKLTFQRKRKEFGSTLKLSDRNVGDISKTVKNTTVDVNSYEDKSYDLNIVEKDEGVQTAPLQVEEEVQTFWGNPQNAYAQYEPREFDEKTQSNLLESEDMKTASENSLPLFQHFLQQNEIINYFFDDYANLEANDIVFSKADNTFKEFQSFFDLLYSKDKAVTHIAWHPTLKGLVAVATSEKYDFDGLVDNQDRILLNASLISLWSFSDPYQPKLYLEAPDDVICFKFCPSDPNILVGGCINGQIVLWDLKDYMEELKNLKPKIRGKKLTNKITEFAENSGITKLRYAAASNFDGSHQAAVTDIQWVPDHFEIQKVTGYAVEAKEQKNVQIISCAADSTLFVWDIRQQKLNQPIPHRREEEKCPMGVPDTFWNLHLKWKPFLSIHLFKSEPGGDHNPVAFSMKEIQGDRSVLLSEEADGKKPETMTNRGDFTMPGQPKPTKQRMLQKVSTFLYVGTEDGELVYVDWMPQKDQDTGKSQTPKPEFYSAIHDGPIKHLSRSPFDRTLILVVGGWLWSLWKEGVNSGPIISSHQAPKPLTSGCWSPTRPSVFFITRSDGSVEVWDLLDKTHEAVLVQNISANALTFCAVHNLSPKIQLLLVGDTHGTTYSHKVPYMLQTPMGNESASVNIYYQREIARRAFVLERWNFREQEKMEAEAKAKREAGVAPDAVPTDEERYQKMKIKYNDYLNEEQAFLRELGLKDEDDEPLPNVE